MSRMVGRRVAKGLVSTVLAVGWLAVCSGQADGLALLEPNPTSVTFASQRVDVQSDPVVVGITNLGTVNSATSIVCTLVNDPPFHDPDAFATSACPSTLAVGASFTIDVTFTPDTTGLLGAMIRIAYNDGAASAYADVSLRGLGFDGPDLVVNGDWSDVALGQQHIAAGPTSPTRQVPMANQHASLSLTITAFTLSGAGCSEFNFSFPPLSVVLAAGASTIFSAAFDPTAYGASTCDIEFVSDDPDPPDHLTVTGVGTNQTIVVTPSEHDFGPIDVFAGAVAQSFDIINDGDLGDLTVSSVSLSGADCDAFALSGVPTTPFDIAPAGGESITVEFDPPAPGGYGCTLVIFSNDPEASTSNVSMTGTGVVTSQVLLVDRFDDLPSANGCEDSTANDCSLRGAIMHANMGAAPDEIRMPPGTYNLSVAGADEDQAATGDLDILEDLTIDAPSGGVTIDASGLDRVFHIPGPATVTIIGVAIQGGQVGSALVGAGGGISSVGNLTLERVSITGCRAGAQGGGVFNDAGGWLGLIGSTVGDNWAAEGGGVFNRGSLVVTDATIGAANVADGSGGGLFNEGSTDLSRSTISENLAHDQSGTSGDHYGGGIYNVGVASATNCTLALNQSPDGYGGAIFNAGALDLKNVTIAGNLANNNQGSAMGNETAAQVEVVNTLIAGTCIDLGGEFSSLGGNLESPGDTCMLDDPTDQVNVSDPGTGELGFHGGLSRCFALTPVSPAIDSASNALCADTDQRELGRPIDGDGDLVSVCDIGSYEYSPDWIFADGFEFGTTDSWSNTVP